MLISEEQTNRIMIVDRSTVARSIISHILKGQMKNISIVTCGSAEEAMDYLHHEKFDLITTSLLLKGLDGLELCQEIRKIDKQRFTPVIVVSSDADMRLLREGFSAGVTDYFNKSLGYNRLVEFIKDVSQRHSGLVGRVLYVEDSPSTAQITKNIMEKHGLYITHVTSAEKALDLLRSTTLIKNDIGELEGFDIVFTDFFLEGQMTGGDLLYAIRTQLHYTRQEMPVLVVTIEDNQKCQMDIYHAGANDFITKPVLEEALITRLRSLLLIKHQYRVLKRSFQNIYELETIDTLTGVYNKDYLFDEGKKFLAKHKNVCLMMVDIDRFEKINETQGHIIGDKVLRFVSRYFVHFFPKPMMVTRFVGQKFVILIADCTLEKGQMIAEKLHDKIKELRPENLEITISIGLTSSEGLTDIPLTTLISNAAHALASAHQQGYNHTCLYVTDKNISTG